jgi:GGDEF domain-containing protein
VFIACVSAVRGGRADPCGGGIPHADASAGVITISIGVALVFPALDRSPDGVVQLADEALYAAKRDGRNTVRVFESEYKDLSTGRFRLK